MIGRFQKLAETLLELRGIEGLMVADPAGDAFDYVLPSWYGEIDRANLGHRFHALVAYLDEVLRDASEVVLTYNLQRAHLFRSNICWLVIFSKREVNQRKLQLAGRHLLKQIRPADMAELSGAAPEKAANSTSGVKPPAPATLPASTPRRSSPVSTSSMDEPVLPASVPPPPIPTPKVKPIVFPDANLMEELDAMLPDDEKMGDDKPERPLPKKAPPKPGGNSNP